MKQQINLYLPEFRTQKDPVTSLLMGQVLGGVLGVMLLISAYDLIHRWQLQSELESQRAALVEETRKTGQLEGQLARRSENTELSVTLAEAELRLGSSRQIRDFLSQTKLGNVRGFSEFFKDLSRASLAGISLQEFELNEGGEGVFIAGQVVDSALVPRYVERIRQGNSLLKGERFSPSIRRDENSVQLFNFELSNVGE